MATDFRDYFNNRISQELDNNAQIGISNKYDSLQAASRQKAIDLNALSKERALIEAKQRQSWVGKLELDPNSPAGTAVNLGASLYSGASRQIGNLISLAPAAVALADESSITPEEMDAYNRMAQGVDTPEDNALLNRKKAFYSERDTPQAKAMAQAMADRNPDTPTALNVIERSVKARMMGRSINEAFDQSSVVQSGRRDNLNDDLGKDFESAWKQTGLANTFEKDKEIGGAKDLITGVARLIYNAGEAAVTNPGAASEYIVENLPQLAGGLFGKAGKAALTASNASYAADNYQQGLENYARENNGAFPSPEERQKMALYAASTFAAEQLGELGQLKAIGKIRKSVTEGSEEAARLGFKQSLLNIGKAVASGGAEEAVTEGYQTFAEGEAQRKPASALDVYIGGVIGGIAGAGTSGGARTVAESLGATPEKQKKREEDADRAQTLNTAIKTGNVDELVDPKNPNYSPADAIAALYGNTRVEGATEETKQTNLERASKIISDLQAERDKASELYDSVSLSKVQEYKTRLDKANADGNTELASMLQEEVNQIENDDASRTRLSKRLERLDGQLKEAQGLLSNFNQENQPKDLDIAEQVAQINGTDPVVSQQAAERVIALSMAIPERLDVELATSLANDMNNPLTAQQRKYLRAFTQARVAENKLKDLSKVSQEVYFGGKDMTGIAEYRSNVTAAIGANNKKDALSRLSLLSLFSVDHRNKAEVTAEALSIFKETGEPQQVISDGNRGWKIHEGKPFTNAEMRKQGGVQINERSEKLVGSIATESEAIEAAYQELNTAIELKFGSTDKNIQPPGGSADVKDVSQALPPSQTTPGTTETAAPTEASAPQDGVASEAGRSTTVEGNANVDEAAQAQQTETQGSQVSTTDGSTEAGVAEDVVTAEDLDLEFEAALEEANASSADSVDTESSDFAGSLDTESVASQLESSGEDTQSPPNEADSETVTEKGDLEVLQNKSPEGTEFQLRNLIADYFTQSAGADTAETKRPLVAVKNFLSQGAGVFTQFLKDKTLSSKQQDALRVFRQMAGQWQSRIQENLAARNEKFRYEDMMQYLLQEKDGKLDVEENVKTAISFAAFSWLAENATRSMYNTDEEINAILDRVENHPVSHEERDLLGNVGTRENVVRNALGKRVADALGLKATKDAPINLMPDLEASLGSHAWKLMMDLGLIERSSVSGTAMAALTGSNATDKNASFNFTRLARDDLDNLSETAKAIVDATMGSQGVLDKMFSVEPGMKEPSFEPIPFVQKKTKNTSQNVPAKLAKIIEHENNVPNFVRQDMWQLLTQLSTDVLQAMAGVVEVNDERVHLVNRGGLQAKNDGLKREIERFMAFVGVMPDLESPLYFDHSVWKQQRVGIATNVINPQTSKVHRFLLYRNAWTTKVDMNDDAQMDNFRLRVLEGMGVKTDKQSNVKSLSEYQARVSNPVIADAVEVLRKAIFDGGITDEDQQVLAAAVKAGGENFHSLDSLVALAHEAQAKASGQTSFTVQMMGEVDGVTNGPMLSHLMLGAADSAKALFGLLNRGGFFQKDSGSKNYNQWRGQPGHLDLYEITALHMTEAVQKMLSTDNKVGVALSAIYAFTGTLAEKDGTVAKAGRNIIKTPLTAMVFGSSVASAVDSMANSFVESVYAGIEDVAAGKADVKTVLDNINTLLILGKGPTIKPMGVDQLLKHEFNPAQIKAIKNAFKNTLGKAVEETMSTDFEAFINKRDTLNRAAQFSFELYNAAYQGLRDDFVKGLIEEGNLAVDAKGVPLHDLTAQQETELKKRVIKLMPVMHTLMSKESKSLGAGLLASKSSRKLSTRDTFKSNVKFGTPIKGTKVWSPKKNAYVEQSSVEATAYEQVETSPGVAMVVMSAHSTDSAISHNALDGNEVLNVHDAHGSGLGGFEETARNLNKATWNAMLSYSPASEMYGMLSRTVLGLAQLLEQKDLPISVRHKLLDVLAEASLNGLSSVRTVIQDVLVETKKTAFEADTLRLQALNEMGSIDQYALEGGQYDVTEEDRAEAAAKQAGLSFKLTTAEEAALDQLDSIVPLPKQGSAETSRELPVLKLSESKMTSMLDFYRRFKKTFPMDSELATKLMGAWESSGRSIDKVLSSLYSDREISSIVLQLQQMYTKDVSQVIGGRGRRPTARQHNEVLLKKLQDATADGKKLLAGDALRLAYESVDASEDTPAMKEFQKKLIKALRGKIAVNTEVALIDTPESFFDAPALLDGANGWYVPLSEKNAPVVALLGPTLSHSRVDVEVLLHELLHAATYEAIYKGQDKNDPNHRIYLQLKDLHEAAIEFVNNLPAAEARRFRYALENVDELVSYGLTNRRFQTEVLAKMRVSSESKGSGNALISGLQKFVKLLTGLFFEGSKLSEKEQAETGLNVLISNAVELMSVLDDQEATVERVLGTTRAMMAEDGVAQDTAEAIDAYTTLDIHRGLDDGSVVPEFQQHLANLLGSIVEKLHGPFGAFAAGMRKTEATNPLTIWLKALDTGKAPFASAIIASGFASSAQEDHAMQQVELTVKAALDGNEASTKFVYRELSKLYTEMRAKLKPSDFASQADYDFVFKLESDNGDRSDYLARFAAMGLASQKFNKLLKVATERDVKRFGEGKTLGERLMTIFEKILAFFNEKVTHTYAGQNADEKLQALVEQLVDVEARKRQLLQLRAANGTSFASSVETKVKEFSDIARQKAASVVGSKFVRENSNAFVRAAGGLARTYANDQVEFLLEGLQRLRDQEFKGRPGIVASLITELKGPLEQFNVLLRESKKHEADRKKIITQHAAMALKAFADGGKTLSKDAKASISSVLMRTGLHNLLDDYTMAQIESLVSDTAVLDAAIQTMEGRLSTQLKDQHIAQANALGYFKATGKARSPVLMLNGYLIARMSGTVYQNQITETEANQEQETITKLVSLYALRYTDPVVKGAAKEVLRTENARTDGQGNGAEFVLKLHKALEQESLDRIFFGNRAQMMHGFTPDILNPHTAIKIAGFEEGKDLINQGYSLGAKVPTDLHDPDAMERHIYVLRDGGLTPYLSGIFSLTSMQARGSKLHNGYMNVDNETGLANASNQATMNGRKMSALQSKLDPRRDLSKDERNNMVPIFNGQGAIVNYRYLMTESTKDNLMERDNRFENIVGLIAGSIYDKETTQTQNAKAVQALRDQYEAEYATRRDAYIFVGAKSEDPEMRTIWRLLPRGTRDEVMEVWGSEGMWVRKDSLDIMFGYRKLSLATMFQKDPEAQNQLEKLIVFTMESILSNYAGYKLGLSPEDARNYAKRAAVIVTRGERGWQELVREAKDIIVIKTGVVMLGNIWSNLSFLAMAGVPMKDILNSHMVAMKGAMAYQTDSKRLAELETKVNLGYTLGDADEIRREMVRLKDAISRNPVRELIDAGLMPSIVEDVTTEEDIYSYKSALTRKTERFTKKLNPNVVKAARTVYMAHDTPMYKTLSEITQLSDFVARYTLYQHLITRQDNPLSKVDAIAEASDAFVNYDIPMHRSLQYADDMGVIMFTKYFLRIQKVLLKLTRENPARVFATIALNNFMNLGPIVLDSHFLGHIGNNPLDIGAFKLPLVLDDLATVKAGMAIVK